MTISENTFDLSNPLPNSSYIANLVAEMEGSPKFIIVGGRPAIGKTHYGIELLRSASLLGGKSSLFFSLELHPQEINQRLVASHSNVSTQKIALGNLSEVEKDAVEKAKEDIKASNISVSSLHEPSLEAIRAICAAHMHKPGGLDVVFIDYLQLMSVSKDVSSNRQEAIATLSRGLKILGRELGITIILFSHLGREVEKRADKTPRLSDLRDSAALEQDSDVVVLLHRPEHYDANDLPGESFAIVAKNRSGALGVYSLNAA